MARTAFETLRVYRLAETFSDRIWNVARKWDRMARDTVGKQLVRAADSIGAHIDEGVGRTSYQDNRRYVRIARGSLNETQHWLRRAYQRKLLDENDIAELRKLVDALGPQLNAYLISIGPTKRTDN